jgi:dihydroxy-acid dehydratase
MYIFGSLLLVCSLAGIPIMAKARRSSRWFDRDDEVGFNHRAALRAEGFTPRSFQNKPVVGIHPWGELNNCNCTCAQLPTR